MSCHLSLLLRVHFTVLGLKIDFTRYSTERLLANTKKYYRKGRERKFMLTPIALQHAFYYFEI